VKAVEIELTEAVAALREELLDAAARGAGQGIGFAVGPIEMEFAVELRADARARTGFKAWVVTVEAEAGGSRASTHRVKVTLTPKQPDGADLLISGTPGQVLAPGDPGHVGR
jgi:hypothetical protein